MIGRALGKRLTYANVVATLALFFALGGTAVAAVMITSNSQVAANTISGHQPPSGKHANLITGSVNATDLASAVKQTFKTHCPGALQRAYDLCFDPSPRAAADWVTAVTTCQNADLRLASVSELAEVFTVTSAPQQLEWSDALSDDSTQYTAMLIDDNSSRQLDYVGATLDNSFPFRCVAAPTN